MSHKDKKFNPQIADEARKHIGEFFKNRRIELGMTQKDLCKSAGLTQPHLSNFEEGIQNVTINTLLALSGCLRLKLYFEEKDPNTVAGFEPLNQN